MSNNFISSVISNAKTYFRDRKLSFYIGFAMAILSIGVSLYYIIVYSAASDFRISVFLLTLLGGLAYLAIALFRLDNVGALTLGLCDFFGMLIFLRTYYPVVLDSDVMSGSFNVTPEIANLIVITVVLLIVSITANVLAWKNQKKVKGDEIEK